ncbi:hypothetical protein [Methanobacterium congolense]|uniref:hypothetical protein n=1 Tax=Methanobacterium congolense TaxID=118062 RepID=UPI0014958A8A|nr:hypothetical protein [Methanobacterium congolense]
MNDMIPDRFLVEYGSILHSEERFSVTIKNNDLLYKEGKIDETSERVNPTEPVTPSENQWTDFWDKMDDIGLWEWNEHYDLCCFDGTQWKVQISLEDMEVESEGANDFPDSFMEFVGALEDLMDMDLKLDFP